jgi:plastocyanin
MQSIRRRRQIRTAGAAACLGVALAFPGAARAQVSGRISVTEGGGHLAGDVGNAVVYLEGPAPHARPERVEMTLDGRAFRPRVVVVPVGSTVIFPNRDPFNHNVFSLSRPNDFDLGLYGRGRSGTERFRHPGLVRVYCNIHPQMVGFVMVVGNAYFTQPEADGSYTIGGVEPGSYTLRVWFERAPEVARTIVVPEGGLTGADVTLDASGYHHVPHMNKYGQEYGSGATRERY